MSDARHDTIDSDADRYQNVTTRIITGKEIEQLKPYCKKRQSSLWGIKHWTIPTLVHTVFGDGKQLISLDPTNSRPDYYIMLADSRIKCFRDALDFISNNEELVFEAIEEEYGSFDDDIPDSERFGKAGAMSLNIGSGYTAGFYDGFNIIGKGR